MSINDGFTHISEDAYRQIVYGHMSPEEAASYLRKKPTIVRGVGETLCRMYPPDFDLRGVLKAYFLKAYPDRKPGSIAKNIQNWLADRNVPSRENLYMIAFALRLSERQLDYLLSIADGCGIQYRDAREMVLAWFLREGHTYAEANAFFESLPPCECKEAPSAEHTRVTQRIAFESHAAHTLDQLLAVYSRNSSDFGTHHLQAYYYFDRWIDQLVMPGGWPSDTSSDEEPAGTKESGDEMLSHDENATGYDSDLLPEESAYSFEKVVNDYLTLRMPSTRRRDNLAPVQKLLKADWPNLTAIKDIRKHKKDVPRKLLLLLYVVTENVGLYDEIDEYFTRESVFENRVRDQMLIINAIMDDCGMARLDMRNAFDWLVIYSVAAEGDEGMSDRMEAVISEMFAHEV